jgi:hypothetical protein
MKKYLFLLFLCLFSEAHAQYSNSFIVEIDERKIRVTSPKNKTDIVSIVVVNKTLDKIISEVRDGNKVLKRFTLKKEGKEVLQIDTTKTKHLSYVPIAPAFESVDLKFSKGPYEVPEAK